MKVLIFMSESDLKPTGWPSWYLYNLNDGLSKIKDKNINICFLPPHGANKKWKIASILMKYRLLNLLLRLVYIFNILNKQPKINIDFNQYDIIHFHTTYDLFMCRNKLKDYKWKICLTSHSPMPMHRELVSDLCINNNYFNEFLFKRLEKIDIFSFNRTNYILFPCKEAEEPYYNQRDKYEEIHKNNKDKYIYLETGLIPISISESKENLRKKYKLQKDDYVLCYVWRHNEVKWYDSLKILWNNYLKEKQNAKFLIAGKEEPLKWLNNDRWVEIGRTNKPYEIIKSSDVFILPNKETYFDLILLEVLSLWKPILLTRTWWNKYFEKFKDSWLFFYDYNNQKEFNSILDKLSHENLDEIWKKNKKIFEENFTSEVFAKKYIEFYKSLF